MKFLKLLSVRSTALLGLVGMLNLAQAPALQAADQLALQPLSDQAAKLPVTTVVEKGPAGENGPYVLKLTNTSKDSLKVSVKILLSVAFHADNKARKLPEQTIETGQTWTVPDLAVADKVIVSSKDYAPLTVTIP